MGTDPPRSHSVARRAFLVGTGVAAWQATSLARTASSGPQPDGRLRDARPNVLWIITDDQPRRSLQTMPHTMRLIAGRGVTFTNGYAAIPWCGPARASMMSGLYAHNHGCLTNFTHPRFVSRGLDQDTVATRMQAAGYVNGYFGKYMNGNAGDPTYVAPGWDRWVVRLTQMTGECVVDGVLREVATNPTEAEAFAATSCIDFVRAHADRPWFAVFAPTSPHRPFTPSRRHRHDFDGVVWDPPSFNEPHMDDKAAFLRGLPERDREKMRRAWEGRLEELRDLDDQIKQLIDALHATNQLRNTVIILVSDNGYLLGEHRMTRKQRPYEESAGIPFLVRGPGISPGTSSALVSQVDLMPTTLELAGLDPDADRPLEGRSMVAGLRSGDWSRWRVRLFSENPVRRWAMLREGHFAFIDYYREQATELYDLVRDPYQLRAEADGPLSSVMQAKVSRLRSASGLELRSLES